MTTEKGHHFDRAPSWPAPVKNSAYAPAVDRSAVHLSVNIRARNDPVKRGPMRRYAWPMTEANIKDQWLNYCEMAVGALVIQPTSWRKATRWAVYIPHQCRIYE